MAKPLANWDDEQQTPPGVVWWSKLDNRYIVEVQRKDGDTGTLYVFDHEDGDKEIFSQSVVFMYGAAFGPDAEQVGEWMDIGANAVDSFQAK